MKWSNLAGALALTVVLGACGSEPEDAIVVQEPICSDTDTLCGTSCVDTESDVRHCGGCDVTCSEGQACSEGECVLLCPGSQQICDSACFRLETSAEHCGACGNACTDGQVCADGSCVDNCPSGQAPCDDGCFDLGSSAEHCGACGDACGAGEVCSEGACVANCSAGLESCDGGCVDLDSTRNHCGACGNACGDGEVCSEGSCALACPAGQEACAGGCFDLDTSYVHCGACGVSCQEGEACVEGACVTSCGDGLTACDGTCRDLQVDPNACGGCGTVCNSDQLCIDGSCELHCASGLSECDGACRDVNRDRAHCGACGNTCADGEFCIDGSCQLSCTGFAQSECDGSCTNTDFDRAHCGSCGTACAAGEVCSNGACVATCDAELDVCPGGCTDLDSDPANCGLCGMVCPAGPGMLAVCVDGACASTCAQGYADCDGNPLNGCEIPLDVHQEHCGGCGISCSVPNASASCTDGSCVIGACMADFIDCDGDPMTGCEVDPASDPNHCGGCGITCAADENCMEGACWPEAGEDCSVPIPVTAGLNRIFWSASRNDYMIQQASCGSVGDPTGGDIVLQYDAAQGGTVTLHFVKQTSNRYEAIISDGPCGTLEPEIECISDWSPAFMEGSFPVEQGKTYWIYVTDTTSGTLPLLNPLEMTLTLAACTPSVPVLVDQQPVAGTTLPNDRPDIRLEFQQPIKTGVGTVTITGDMGTNLTLQLPSNDVVFSDQNKVMEVLPGMTFPSGEQVTVTVTGLEDYCESDVLPAPITWSFTVPTVPCRPGQNGMVGNSITRVTTNTSKLTLTEYYVVPDTDPNGWVYIGGTTTLFRMSKIASGIPEKIHVEAGLASSQLGYAMTIDGQNLYTLESKTSGTDGHIWRISSDGGATWNPQDAIHFPYTPGDDFRSAVVRDGVMYLLTAENTASQDTEIWTADVSGPLPASATMHTAFGSSGGTTNPYMFCMGIDVDASYIYTRCRQGSSSNYALLRFDRHMPGNPPVELLTGLIGNTIAMTLDGKDLDADGIFDVLYLSADKEEGQFVCDPNGMEPFYDLHYDFGGATTNYGGGLDPVQNVIWSYDDDTRELILIQ